MLCPNCKTSVPDRSNEVDLLEAQVRQLSQRLAHAGTPLAPNREPPNPDATVGTAEQLT
jgi:hypothetical protein